MSLWMKIDEETVKKLKEQRDFEEHTANRLGTLSDSVTNSAVKMFLQGIISDTTKHANMYQTLIDLNEKALLGKINREMMNKELNAHITEENKMLNRAIEISKSLDDVNFKALLERIVEDERRHHSLLKELYEIIKKEGEDWNRYFYEIMKDYP